MVWIRMPYKNAFICVYERKYVQESRDTEKENRRHQALSGAAARTGNLYKNNNRKVMKKRSSGYC